MTLERPAVADASRILELARRDRGAARDVVATLAPEEQAALVLELPVSARARMLELLPAPEAVVPLLPEAELCFVAKAIGLADAGWLLACASDEQIQASLDLDVWSGDALDPAALDAWVDAFDDAGEETLLRAARGIDPELLYAWLRSRIGARIKPEGDDFQPEPGEQTLDGQFWLRAVREGDDLEPLLRLLRLLFEHDYWLYFRMLQALGWEDPTENEEFARRWREGRLQDLGFPAWDEAMAVYGYLRPRERAQLPADETPLDVEAWRLPVYLPELPMRADARHRLFRAAALLDEEERRAFFFAFVALANKVAVADRLPLGDAESTPAAIEKAAAMASRGLAHLSQHHAVSDAELLRRVRLERLFRIGVSIDQDERPRPDPTR